MRIIKASIFTLKFKFLEIDLHFARLSALIKPYDVEFNGSSTTLNFC